MRLNKYIKSLLCTLIILTTLVFCHPTFAMVHKDESNGINTHSIVSEDELSKNAGGGMEYIPSPNKENDALKGGDLVINSTFNIPGNSVVTYHLLKYNVHFRITWTVPGGMTADDFINSINIGKSFISLGGNKMKLSKEQFLPGPNGTVQMKAEGGRFDLIAMVRYLWTLLFGGGTAKIDTSIHLNVDSFSNNFPLDFSKNHVVTTNKLIPNSASILKSDVHCYDKEDALKSINNLTLKTWNSYISPWNKSQADGNLNGKVDDTQSNGSLEVMGTPRVLKGNDYKSRIIDLPITQKILPMDYARVVNLFTKKVVTNYPLKTDSPIEDNQFSEQGDTKYLTRSTTYYYRSADSRVLLSPVPINFIQKTYLKFDVKPIDKYEEYQNIPIEGTVSSEGKEYKYYFTIDHGNKNTLINTSKNINELNAEIPGLNKGEHTITIGVINEFGITKECTFKTNIVGGELSLISAPSNINFGTVKLSPEVLHLKGKIDKPLTVLDDRDDKQDKKWQLSLRETQPLSSNIKMELDYVNRNNKTILINDKNQIIEHNLQNSPKKDTISNSWENKDKGLFLNIPPEYQKIGNYFGLLTWTLQDTPTAN